MSRLERRKYQKIARVETARAQFTEPRMMINDVTLLTLLTICTSICDVTDFAAKAAPDERGADRRRFADVARAEVVVTVDHVDVTVLAWSMRKGEMLRLRLYCKMNVNGKYDYISVYFLSMFHIQGTA